MTCQNTFRSLAFACAAVLSASIWTAQAETYYWIGGASGNWASGSNWSLTEGGAAANAYPNDYSADEATVGTEATIVLPSANANVLNLHVNAPVTLTGGRIHADTIDGSGVLTMADGTYFHSSKSTLLVQVPVVIPENATVKCTTSGDYNGVQLAGTVTGAGTIRFEGSRASHVLSGDFTAFAGTINVVNDSVTRNNTTIRSLQSCSAAARWVVYNSSADDAIFIRQEGTYSFGSLSGTLNFKGKTADAYAFVKNVTLEIGALGLDDAIAGQLSRSGSRSNDGLSIRKVGAGTLTMSAPGVNVYTLQEGVLELASDAALSYANDAQRVDSRIVFAGGSLKLAEAVTRDASKWIGPATSSATVIVDDGNVDREWTTRLGAGLTGGFTKRGTGTLTLTSVPAYSGKTTIEQGRILFPVGTVIENLEVAEGASLGLYTTAAYTEPTQVITINQVAEGTDLQTVFPNTPTVGFEFDVDDDTGVVTVKATRLPATFVWSGAVNSQWDTAANWLVNGEAVTESPKAEDTVQFPATETPWVVEMPGERKVARVEFLGETKLLGASLRPVEIGGDAKIVLGDAARIMTNGKALMIMNAIEVVASADAPAVLYWSGSSQSIGVTGTITGNGVLESRSANKANFSGVIISGSMADFAGTFRAIDNEIGRNMSRLDSVEAVSPKAIYDVVSGNTTFLNVDAGSDVTFGMLTGTITHQDQSNHNHLRVTIDALGLDGALGGYFFSTAYPHLTLERGHTVCKVGAGTIDFTAVYVKQYEINGGLLNFGKIGSIHPIWKPSSDGKSYEVQDEATEETVGEFWSKISFKGDGGVMAIADTIEVDPSSVIVDSTAPIAFSNDTDRVWSTALAASNVGGFTKKGTGTLTLAAQPEYSGTTRIEGGKLVIGEGTFDCRTTTVVVENPAQAAQAGTVYLAAPALANVKDVVMESSAADRDKYKLSKRDVDGKASLVVVKAMVGTVLVFR